MLRSCFILATAALLLSPLTQAEEANLSLRTLAIEQGALPKWHIEIADGEYRELTWPDGQPSPSIVLPATKDLVLFLKAKNPDGEEVYQSSMQVALPVGESELLLIAIPAAEEGAKPRVKALADNLKTAKFNEWLFINESGQRVAIKIGEKQAAIELDADVAKLHAIDPALGNGGKVSATSMRNDEMKPFYSTFWGAPKEQRSLVIFYNDDHRVRLRRISDFLPKDEE